jgi:hypothetical protein
MNPYAAHGGAGVGAVAQAHSCTGNNNAHADRRCQPRCLMCRSYKKKERPGNTGAQVLSFGFWLLMALSPADCETGC